MWDIRHVCVTHSTDVLAKPLQTPRINKFSHTVIVLFFFFFTWLAHPGSAEDGQLHLRAFSHDSSCGKRRSAKQSVRSAVHSQIAASEETRVLPVTVLSFDASIHFNPVISPPFFFFYSSLAGISTFESSKNTFLSTTTCESYMCFSAGSSTFSTYFGRKRHSVERGLTVRHIRNTSVSRNCICVLAFGLSKRV